MNVNSECPRCDAIVEHDIEETDITCPECGAGFQVLSFRKTGRPCCICGADPCEAPGACQAQARYENEDHDA